MRPADDRSRSVARFYALSLALPLLLAGGLLYVLETTDRALATLEAVYDRGTGRFPWREHWVTEQLLHNWAKYAVIALGVALLAGLAASFRSPLWRVRRRRIVYVLVCMTVGTVLTAALKKSSGRYCPWALEQFGGWAPYVRLLEPPVRVGKAGGCFPCGHASTAFALTSLYFALRDVRPRAARWTLAGVLTFGFVLGAGRIVQGAHFPSHVFATALLCWLVSLLFYELMLRRADSARS